LRQQRFDDGRGQPLLRHRHGVALPLTTDVVQRGLDDVHRRRQLIAATPQRLIEYCCRNLVVAGEQGGLEGNALLPGPRPGTAVVHRSVLVVAQQLHRRAHRFAHQASRRFGKAAVKYAAQSAQAVGQQIRVRAAAHQDLLQPAHIVQPGLRLRAGQCRLQCIHVVAGIGARRFLRVGAEGCPYRRQAGTKLLREQPNRFAAQCAQGLFVRRRPRAMYRSVHVVRLQEHHCLDAVLRASLPPAASLARIRSAAPCTVDRFRLQKRDQPPSGSCGGADLPQAGI
jgi:hypothetical protein